MDPLLFLANLLLSVTVGTLMVAFVAYVAYKIREVRKPDRHQMLLPGRPGDPVFLRRYVPVRLPDHQRLNRPEP